MMDYDWIKQRSWLSQDKPAVIDALTEERYTYQDMNKRALRLAHYLQSAYGIQKGDRVALLAPNDVAYLDLIFACMKLGAIFIPLNWRLQPEELRHVINDCIPVCVFYATEMQASLEKNAPKGLIGLNVNGEDYQNIVSEDSPFPATELGPDIAHDDPQIIIYTSGTTGLPKGAMLSYSSVRENALNTILNWGMVADDVALVNAPLFHVAGLCGNVIPLLMVGGTIVLQRFYDPTVIIHYIKIYQVTFSFMVPTMYYELIRQDDFSKEGLKSLKVLISGGAPPLASVQEAFSSIGFPLINSYGLTESGPNNFRLLAEEVAGRPDSIGRPSVFVKTRIVDEHYNDVPDGEIGELLLAGRHNFLGYWGKPKETAEVFHGDYVKTGDLARKDADGYYYIVNRKKELIITGGENVVPSEVENVLRGIPWIEEVIAVGYPDEKYGEAVGVAIKLKERYLIEDLLDVMTHYARPFLAGYKIPRRVLVIEDDFPKNSVGKIDRQALSKLLDQQG